MATSTICVDAIACGPDGLVRPAGEVAWAVRVQNGVISSVDECPSQSGRLRILTPTLVNAHDHGRGHGTQLLGVRDAPLREWISAFVGATRQDVQYEQVSVALAQMRDGGIGAATICVNPTTSDRDQEVRIAAAAARDIGIRAAIAVPIFTVPPETYREGRHCSAQAWLSATAELDRVDALADELSGDGIEILYHPVGPQWVSEDLLRACAQRSAATGRIVHMHLLETTAQRNWAMQTYHDGMVAAFGAMGLLTPSAVFAHGVYLSDDELALLAANGCSVVINVSSNFRLASGIAPIDRIAAAGANFGIGLDGMALDDDLDMWRELRLVRGLWQAQRLATVDAAEVIQAATTAGALGLGTAAPEPVRLGNRADFVVHDLSKWVELAELPAWPAPEIVLAGASRLTVAEVWCRGARVYLADQVEC
ncbi:MAG TPA: amidohydrolase family protein [Candidatus Acidoferrum sp.]|nr:amidohydrolase family protein [Candidatus Acidoferrum sp.]